VARRTRRERIRSLEGRLKWLGEKEQALRALGKPVSYLTEEREALEWALPILRAHVEENVARWVDVRVKRDDEPLARAAILAAFAPVDMVINTNPHQAPSARAGDGTPGEVELRVCDRPERAVVRVIAAQGIEVLAARTRMGARLEVPG
jgi:hypothetical protein